MVDENLSDCVDQMAVDVVDTRASPDSNILELPSRAQAGLPFDVLSQIFLSCLPDDSFPTLSAEEAPTVLGRVCSHWREVAFATHVLWAALDVTASFLSSPIFNPFDRRIALGIQEWMRRAGECALSYRLSFSTTGQMAGVVNTILPHRKHWKHLEGRLPTQLWQYIVSAIAEGAPLLEHLDISTETGYNTITIQLSSTPLLQTLIVDSNAKVLGLDKCGKSLRRLSIRVADWNSCWLYLVHCPTLEILNVKHDYRIDGPSPSTVVSDVGVLETRNLVSLSIRLSKVGPLLDRLCSPALKTISFKSNDADTKLLSFLARSRPPLESLNITARFSSKILLDSLRLTPTLTSLGVHLRPKLTDADIKLLQLGPDSEKIICPGLQNIEFDRCVKDARMKPMEDMVLSRWETRDISHSMNSESTSTQNYQWQRSLRYLRLVDCGFEEYSSKDSTYFGSQPEIARCIEEGLEVVEVLPSDSDSD